MADPKPRAGRVSRSNPSWAERRMISLAMRTLADPRRREAARRRAERKRQRAGAPHRVEYFHQVDDPWFVTTCRPNWAQIGWIPSGSLDPLILALGSSSVRNGTVWWVSQSGGGPNGIQRLLEGIEASWGFATS